MVCSQCFSACCGDSDSFALGNPMELLFSAYSASRACFLELACGGVGDHPGEYTVWACHRIQVSGHIFFNRSELSFKSVLGGVACPSVTCTFQGVCICRGEISKVSEYGLCSSRKSPYVNNTDGSVVRARDRYPGRDGGHLERSGSFHLGCDLGDRHL